MSVNNYAEETKPLFKMLRTEAFRFVIVRYNHFSFVQQLEKDIQRLFPDRPFTKLNAQKAEFENLTNLYFSLTSGFLFIENFDDVLKEQFDSQGKETPQYKIENERRRSITAGLNLRRDKLAKYPIAIFVFVPATTGELYAKIIMEKMPDLWSFRSLILDLEREPEIINEGEFIKAAKIELQTSIGETKTYIDPQNPVTTKYDRLVGLLNNTPENEIDYRLTLYPQITAAAKDIGAYEKAIYYFDEWEKLALDEDKGLIWVSKGDVLTNIGNIEQALLLYEKAFNRFKVNDNKLNEAVSLERLGLTHSALGNLDKALTYFEDEIKLFKELYDASRNNLDFKNGLAISYEKLGNTYFALGNLDKALELYEKRHRLSKDLYAAYPNNLSFKNGLAISYSNLGQTYAALGFLDDALGFYEEYNRLEKELYAAYSNNVEIKNNLVISYSKLGEAHISMGNMDKALGFYEEQYKLSKELYAAYPKNVSFKNILAISYSKLGYTHAALGNIDNALKFYEDETKLFEELYADYPTNIYFKNGLAVSYQYLGNTYITLGNLEKALWLYKENNRLSKELYAEYPKNVSLKNGLAISYWNLGEIYKKLDSYLNMVVAFQNSNELLVELFNSFPQNVEFKNNLAESYLSLGNCYVSYDKSKAKAYFKQAEALWIELVRYAPQYVKFQRFLGIVQEVLAGL
jgi:tetratricopeptide (TPR) repeat protein